MSVARKASAIRHDLVPTEDNDKTCVGFNGGKVTFYTACVGILTRDTKNDTTWT